MIGDVPVDLSRKAIAVVLTESDADAALDSNTGQVVVEITKCGRSFKGYTCGFGYRAARMIFFT